MEKQESTYDYAGFSFKKKGHNDLHNELGHLLEKITRAMRKTVGLMVTGMFKTYEDCDLEKVKNVALNEKAVVHSSLKGEWLFINNNSPSTSSIGSFILEHITDCIWRYFSIEMS